MNRTNEPETCLGCPKMSTCFKTLTHEQLVLTSHNKVTLRFKKGDVVAKQGAFATHLMFLKSGLLKVYKEGGSGQNSLIINIFSPGKIIGLSSIYGDNTFTYSVAAIEDSTLCLIDLNAIREIIPQNGNFAVSIIKKLSQNNLLAYELLYGLTHKQLNGRMASAILFLAKDVYKDMRFKLTLSRKDLAEFTSMSVMSVTRVINELKETEVIKEDHGVIEIVNPDMLKRISEFG